MQINITCEKYRDVAKTVLRGNFIVFKYNYQETRKVLK